MKMYTNIPKFDGEESVTIKGKIRLGKRRVTQKGEFPTAVSYFVVEHLPDVAQVYGNEPHELVIMLPSDDIEQVLPFSYVAYGADNKVRCNGNGEEAQFKSKDLAEWVPITERTEIDKIVVGPCGERCPWFNPTGGAKQKCALSGKLRFVLPDVNAFWIYEINTASRANIIDMRSELMRLNSLLGKISWVPLTLSRVERATNYTDKSTGKLKSTKNYFLTLQMAQKATWNDVQALAGQRMQLENRGSIKAIDLPPVDADEEQLVEPDDPILDTQETEEETALGDLIRQYCIKTGRTKKQAEECFHGKCKGNLDYFEAHINDLEKKE